MLLAAAPLLAETALTPHSAIYKVKISVLGGELRTRLQSTDTAEWQQSIMQVRVTPFLIGPTRVLNRSSSRI